MQWSQVKNQWNDVKGKVQAQWTKLSDADLQTIAGKRDELVTRVKDRYAMEKTKAEKAVDDFIKKLH